MFNAKKEFEELEQRLRQSRAKFFADSKLAAGGANGWSKYEAEVHGGSSHSSPARPSAKVPAKATPGALLKAKKDTSEAANKGRQSDMSLTDSIDYILGNVNDGSRFGKIEDVNGFFSKDLDDDDDKAKGGTKTSHKTWSDGNTSYTSTITSSHHVTKGGDVDGEFFKKHFDEMFGGLISDRFGHFFEDDKFHHDFFKGIDWDSGAIRGAIHSNHFFGFGGKGNDVGPIGKRYLENIISKRFKRKIKPFIPEPLEPDLPTPTPAPKPAPVPEPSPEPKPEPKPVPAPEPSPVPEPKPTPVPEPAPKPVQPEPKSDLPASGKQQAPPTPPPVPATQATDSRGQNFSKLRADCLQRKVLFEDPLFPATRSSLFVTGKQPQFEIQWRRPAELCKDPQFFVDGSSRFDVEQGELGDCWLLAATADLTLREELFYRVVPPDQSFTENYAGIFHFQFYQYGDWVDVVVDDRLPTRDGKLLYMHSETCNEYWSSLMEKAYAKLNGSYQALTGGSTGEALEDFTGGLIETFNLTKPLPQNFDQILLKAPARGSLMGCSIISNVMEGRLSNGLITSHAYSITGVNSVDYLKTGKEVELVRVRNPWGNEAEWKGAWGDDSTEWNNVSEAERKEIGLVKDHDGEFWMSVADFKANFTNLELCHLGPEVADEIFEMTGAKLANDAAWHSAFFHGKWVNGISAGGCANNRTSFASNPQYWFTLTDEDASEKDGLLTCLVAVMQKNRRQCYGECEDYFFPIGFAVFKIDKPPPAKLGQEFFDRNRSVAKSEAFVNSREVSARFRRPPANYIVVPSTFDTGSECEFLLRFYADGAVCSGELK